VTVVCGSAEDCVVSAKGALSVAGPARVFALTPAKAKSLGRGKRRALKLGVPRKARATATSALRRRKRVRATVTVRVADAAGNARTLKRVIRLKR
jgi:hypothetical protein